MLDKRGQATIFIIIAIVIVVVIAAGAIFYTEKSGDMNNPNLDLPEVQEVKSYIDGCLDEVSNGAVIYIGEQGGYYDLPEKSNYFSFFGKPYYIYGNENLVVKKEFVEREISSYINESIDFCISNFSDFASKGYVIKARKRNVETTISSSRVNVDLKWDIIIEKGDLKSNLKVFNTELSPIYLPKILQLSNEISLEETLDPSTMCITCIDDLAEKYGVSVDIFDTSDRNQFIFVIIDEASNFSGSPYQYSFAAKYDFPQCDDSGECFDALNK